MKYIVYDSLTFRKTVAKYVSKSPEEENRPTKNLCFIIKINQPSVVRRRQVTVLKNILDADENFHI